MSVGKVIKNYIKNHPFIFIISLLVIALVTVFSILPAQILRIIVDDVLTNNDKNKLLLFAIIYTLTFVAIALINFFKEFLLVLMSEGVSKDLRIKMLEKVHKITYLNFVKYDTGILESYIANDVDEINTLISSGAISMIIDMFKIIAILISIFAYSFVLGLTVMFIIPVIVLITMIIRKRMYKAQLSNKRLEADVNNMVLESIDNIRTIKSFRIYYNMMNKYSDILQNHFKTNQKVNNYDSLFNPIMQIIKYALIVFVIASTGSNLTILAITCGELVSSIDLISNLFSPIESIGTEIQTIQKAKAALHRINEFFKLEEDETKNIDDVELDSNELEFKDVNFSYDLKQNVINDFYLSLSNNDKITIKGRSGSGKSTLFKLTYGLIKPNTGSVLINNKDVYYLKDDVKNKIFGILYQDTFFSGGTIREELTLLDKEIQDEEIFKVLSEVGLKRVTNIDKRLNEEDFSTGELQMFNVARVLLRNPKIILIDELNAKLDYETSKNIIDFIGQKFSDKIILSINHFGPQLKDSKIINLEKI